MEDSYVPPFISEWVANHPVLAPVIGVLLLIPIAIFAIRYGRLRNWWP